MSGFKYKTHWHDALDWDWDSFGESLCLQERKGEGRKGEERRGEERREHMSRVPIGLVLSPRGLVLGLVFCPHILTQTQATLFLI